ncbi:MAG TPA: zinc-ribbon domain-containing protein [Caulobacteraceae bacterium]|jgi:predicted Zn finger-like uncharacterized protein|nr:zinc-ribbon domain-containing protein [Caulobacteraceae bacterium]
MILTCPRCATRYEVDETDIRPEGRLVRCSACDQQWRAFSDGRESVVEEAAAPAARPTEAVPASAAPTPFSDPREPDRPERATPQTNTPQTDTPETGAREADPRDAPTAASLRFRPLEDGVLHPVGENAAGSVGEDVPAESDDEPAATPRADAPFVAPVRPPPPRRRGGLAWLIAAVILIIVVAGALVGLREQVVQAAPGAAGAYSALGLGPPRAHGHDAPHG